MTKTPLTHMLLVTATVTACVDREEATVFTGFASEDTWIEKITSEQIDQREGLLAFNQFGSKTAVGNQE